MPLKAVSFSMARRALLKAKPAADACMDALFPPKGACLFCPTELRDSDFRQICDACSQRLLSWFCFERRAPGEFWDQIDCIVAGRIRATSQKAPVISPKIQEGNAAAMVEISRAMATCMPPIRYLRTDGVYLFTEGLEAGRQTQLKALGRQLARSLACDYLGQAGKGGSDWQEEAIVKYGGGSSRPIAAYPVLVCETTSVNEAAALLSRMHAKEIIWADTDVL